MEGGTEVESNYTVEPILRHGFDPYKDNAGSMVAIAGEDFAVIGSDTRLSLGFSILSRNQSKLFKLTDRSVLAASGCWADCVSFTKFLEVRLKMYHFEHNQPMFPSAIAQCCSTMLYGRRFFPYFSWLILAGLDEEGKGVVYGYDPVGSMEKLPYAVAGSSSALLMPLLDCIIGKKNQVLPDPAPLTKAKAIDLIKDVFISATEREITCGDAAHIMVVSKSGIEEYPVELRKD